MPVSGFAATVLVAAVAAALVAGAWSDLRTRRIPNQIPALLALLYPLVFFFYTAAPTPWWGGLVAGAGLLILGAGLFAVGALGGGDVKLLAAAALWAGPAYLLEMVLITGLAGGALTLPALLRRLVAARVLGPGTVAGGETIPYGVAIAAGGLWAVLQRFGALG